MKHNLTFRMNDDELRKLIIKSNKDIEFLYYMIKVSECNIDKENSNIVKYKNEIEELKTDIEVINKTIKERNSK